MKNYIVRVYRARTDNMDSASGYIEDTESGRKDPFHSIDELQTLLANSIRRGQPGLPDFTVPELIIEDRFSVIA